MSAGDLEGDRFLLRHETLDVGIVDVEARDKEGGDGRLTLADDIIKGVGWKCRRIRDALEAMAEYLRMVQEEGEDGRSAEFKAALDRVEQGEVGHYLQPDDWTLMDEGRRERKIAGFGFLADGSYSWEWGDPAQPAELDDRIPLFGAHKNLLRFRMELREEGRHVFGGPARHKGVRPEGSEIPLHHFATLDLADLNSPIRFDPEGVRFLPLYYSLAYGFGGSEVQYAVESDDAIRILHMSDPEPDPSDEAYVQVAHLPEARADIIPLTYAETRMRVMSERDDVCDLSAADEELRENMGGSQAMLFGGQAHANLGDEWVCHNPDCSIGKNQGTFAIEPLISIPPIPVQGKTDFWYEFEGSVDFCFFLCPECRAICATNVCT